MPITYINTVRLDFMFYQLIFEEHQYYMHIIIYLMPCRIVYVKNGIIEYCLHNFKFLNLSLTMNWENYWQLFLFPKD
jgi:hypothetical protein